MLLKGAKSICMTLLLHLLIMMHSFSAISAVEHYSQSMFRALPQTESSTPAAPFASLMTQNRKMLMSSSAKVIY